jgi:hypothetical protein
VNPPNNEPNPVVLLELNLGRILDTLKAQPQWRPGYRPGLMLTDIATRSEATLADTNAILTALNAIGIVERLAPPPTHYRLTHRP